MDDTTSETGNARVDLGVRLILTADRGGDLGVKAATYFVVKCRDVIWPNHPWLVYSGDDVWIDWDKVMGKGVDLSGGTVAAWTIARSMVRGDLAQAWRMDTQRSAELVRALRLYLVGDLT